MDQNRSSRQDSSGDVSTKFYSCSAAHSASSIFFICTLESCICYSCLIRTRGPVCFSKSSLCALLKLLQLVAENGAVCTGSFATPNSTLPNLNVDVRPFLQHQWLSRRLPYQLLFQVPPLSCRCRLLSITIRSLLHLTRHTNLKVNQTIRFLHSILFCPTTGATKKRSHLLYLVQRRW